MLERSLRRTAFLPVLLCLLVACSANAVKTYPVNGKVQIADGDVAMLTGSSIELRHETEPFLRPIGNLDPAGHFMLRTLYAGELLEGAPEGRYRARIVLADETDEGVPKRKGDPVHRRYYDFETSGLSIAVPSGDYTVTLSRK